MENGGKIIWRHKDAKRLFGGRRQTCQRVSIFLLWPVSMMGGVSVAPRERNHEVGVLSKWKHSNG